MPKRTRDILLRFFVTAREKSAIQKRMELVGLKNMSTYLRKIATNGYLLNVDLSCFDKMLEDIHGVSKNINQLQSASMLRTISTPQICRNSKIIRRKSGSFFGRYILSFRNKSQRKDGIKL